MRAFNIKWDTDGDMDVLESLPKEMDIPEGMEDEEEGSAYISDQTGWCHFRIELGPEGE